MRLQCLLHDRIHFGADAGLADKQLKGRKQYEAMKQWIEDLKTSAQLKVLPLPETPPPPAQSP